MTTVVRKKSKTIAVSLLLYLCVMSNIFSQEGVTLPSLHTIDERQGIEALNVVSGQGISIHLGRRSAKDRINSIFINYKEITPEKLYQQVKETYGQFNIADAIVGENEMALQINGERVLICIWKNGPPQNNGGVNLVLLCDEYLVIQDGKIKSVYSQKK